MMAAMILAGLSRPARPGAAPQAASDGATPAATAAGDVASVPSGDAPPRFLDAMSRADHRGIDERTAAFTMQARDDRAAASTDADAEAVDDDAAAAPSVDPSAPAAEGAAPRPFADAAPGVPALDLPSMTAWPASGTADHGTTAANAHARAPLDASVDGAARAGTVATTAWQAPSAGMTSPTDASTPRPAVVEGGEKRSTAALGSDAAMTQAARAGAAPPVPATSPVDTSAEPLRTDESAAAPRASTAAARTDPAASAGLAPAAAEVAAVAPPLRPQPAYARTAAYTGFHGSHADASGDASADDGAPRVVRPALPAGLLAVLGSQFPAAARAMEGTRPAPGAASAEATLSSTERQGPRTDAFANRATAPLAAHAGVAVAAPNAGAETPAAADFALDSAADASWPAAQAPADADASTDLQAPALKLPAEAPSRWRQPLAEALGQRLQVQVTKGSEHAVIRLDPPNLGRIDISIRHDAAGLQVHLGAANPDVLRQLHVVSDGLRQDLAQRQGGDVTVRVSDLARGSDGLSGDARGRERQPDRQGDDEARRPGRALAEADTESAAGFSPSRRD